MVLDLLNHGTLKTAEHFERRDGGVFLNLPGRRRFFVAYERRMTRDFFSEQLGCRTTLRGVLHQQALAVKKAVMDDEGFEPFVMN
jgi:CRISPR-associated protein Cas1